MSETNVEQSPVVLTHVRQAVLLHDALSTLLASPYIFTDEALALAEQMFREMQVHTEDEHRLITAASNILVEHKRRRVTL